MKRKLVYNKNEKRVNDTVNKEHAEDTSKYGEFIPSEFGWITPNEQKSKAKKMENITKDKKD